jgi:hypothetical protein
MINTPGPRASGATVPSPPRAFTVTWLLLLAPALLLVAALSTQPAAAQHSGPEYALKAAFVSKFPHFAEWPESALANRNTIDVCVAKPNPFGEALSELIAGEHLGERALNVRYIDGPALLPGCHVLFIPSRPSIDRKVLLSRAAALPILTVGDYASFLDEGGIVKLLMVDGRVRFEVNVATAGRVGLRLSSQLLQLALNVRGGPR